MSATLYGPGKAAYRCHASVGDTTVRKHPIGNLDLVFKFHSEDRELILRFAKQDAEGLRAALEAALRGVEMSGSWSAEPDSEWQRRQAARSAGDVSP